MTNMAKIEKARMRLRIEAEEAEADLKEAQAAKLRIEALERRFTAEAIRVQLGESGGYGTINDMQEEEGQ